MGEGRPNVKLPPMPWGRRDWRNVPMNTLRMVTIQLNSQRVL